MDFLRQKSVFFFAKIFWWTPCNWGAWAHFRRTHYSWALSKRSSARSRRAMAVAPMFFFFADFVTCANFSNLWGKFLETHNRYGHHVSAKSCAGSWATFSPKKIFEKKSASWFFLKRSFEKTLFLTVFYVWSPISQNQDQIQGPCFRVIYKRFIGCIFAQKWRQNFFHTWFFGQKKGWKKMSKIFFSFVAHISPNWRKIQKPFPLKTNSKDVS